MRHQPLKISCLFIFLVSFFFSSNLNGQNTEGYQDAINRYNASLKLAEKAGDSLSVSYTLSNIAGILVIQKKFDEAEHYLLRCLHIRDLLKDSFAIALALSDLGTAMSEKGEYDKAAYYLERSNFIAEKVKYTELEANNYSELSNVAQRRGDMEKAFEYYNKWNSYRDSLFNLERNKELQRLNSQFESLQKEQQIKEQKQRIRLQNLLFLGLGVLILLAVLLVFSSYKRYRLKKETQLQSEIMKQQDLKVKAVMEAEENERQRIAQDLHDGIGQMMSAAKMNLSAFESGMAEMKDDQKLNLERIISLVDDSCRELRTVSHIMMPNALLKNNLDMAIKDFVSKLSGRELEVHVYTERLDQRFESNLETMLYRVVQECVHNAIKHAQATTLDISMVRDKDGITGTIEDNGKGFDINSEDFDGIGLKNIRTRIAYLKGTVDIDSSPGRGTVVAFHVPVL